MFRRFATVVLAFAVLASLANNAEAVNPLVYTYSVGRSYRAPVVLTNPQPHGFYNAMAATASRYHYNQIHRNDSYYPDNAVWQQAQNIQPTMIINPYVEISEQTQKLIDSPYRNFPIQTANP